MLQIKKNYVRYFSMMLRVWGDSGLATKDKKKLNKNKIRKKKLNKNKIRKKKLNKNKIRKKKIK